MEKEQKKIGAPRKDGDKKVNAGISTEKKKVELLGIERVRRICQKAIDANYDNVLLQSGLKERAGNPNQLSII